ncbi:MAG: hypothetical protein U0169_12180 [Polyangiaceae bacterium]
MERRRSLVPHFATLVSSVSVLAMSVVSTGCGANNDEPYKPAPAWTGRKASLPAPPANIVMPPKVGDTYSVARIIHDLRSRIHEKEVNGKEVTITGYIVESNIPTAPKCAQHPTGKKDPENCTTEIPSFWIGDVKGDDKGKKIRVLGWASNFANVYDAMQKYKGLKEAPKKLVMDELKGVEIPFPLPAVGAKVKVTGKYGYTYQGSGLVSDPNNGVLTYGKVEVLEPAPEPAAFAAK